VTLLPSFSFFSAVSSASSRDDSFLLSPPFYVPIPYLFIPFKFGPPFFVSSTLGLQISLFFLYGLPTLSFFFI